MKKERISYAEAINQGIKQSMEINKDVFVMGQLIEYSPGAFGTTAGLVEKFGADRVRDFPASESAMTTAAIGAALSGKRPILVHMRIDFMIYSLDAIVNWLAMWRFKSNKESKAPVTIRAIVGRGWGQGPQHSKSLHSWFAHLPGINVIMPSTPFDAKGLLIESVFSNNPTIIIEHRSLFNLYENVPIEPYTIKIGKGLIRKKGKDITAVTVGNAVIDTLKASEKLKNIGIDVEVVDLRSLTPIDKNLVFSSVKKTRRLVVIDAGWESFGAASEIISLVSENKSIKLKSNPFKICLPDSHTPMSAKLEKSYYFDENKIFKIIRRTFNI